MNTSKENYIIQMIKAIDSCKGNTCYTDAQIEKMKSDGTKIFSEIFALDGTKYFLEEQKKEVDIKFEKYVFGHNDFQVHCSDYLMKKAMKEIFYELKKEDTKLEIKAKIGHQGSNGWGTAFLLSYDLK